MRYLILTGMSGAGKTVAIRHLEDLGALCVDNLPPIMMLPFLQACAHAETQRSLIAIATDIRSGEFFDARGVVQILEEARQLGLQADTLFFEASDEVLLNRYKETRRDHPLGGEGYSLPAAIREERLRLEPLRETATYLIDTGNLKPKGLQKKLDELLDGAGEDRFRVEILSFGFKRGLPREADLVFDVRFLPNPYYIPELCRHTGLEKEVREYVLNHPVTREFVEKTMNMLLFLLPNYAAEGKHRLTVAVGCTGGAHRSVAIAETLGKGLREAGWQVSVGHRDIALEQANWETLQDPGEKP